MCGRGIVNDKCLTQTQDAGNGMPCLQSREVNDKNVSRFSCLEPDVMNIIVAKMYCGIGCDASAFRGILKKIHCDCPGAAYGTTTIRTLSSIAAANTTRNEDSGGANNTSKDESTVASSSSSHSQQHPPTSSSPQGDDVPMGMGGTTDDHNAVS